MPFLFPEVYDWVVIRFQQPANEVLFYPNLLHILQGPNPKQLSLVCNMAYDVLLVGYLFHLHHKQHQQLLLTLLHWLNFNSFLEVMIKIYPTLFLRELYPLLFNFHHLLDVPHYFSLPLPQFVRIDRHRAKFELNYF